MDGFVLKNKVPQAIKDGIPLVDFDAAKFVWTMAYNDIRPSVH
jgi:hypothetical protein